MSEEFAHSRTVEVGAPLKAIDRIKLLPVLFLFRFAVNRLRLNGRLRFVMPVFVLIHCCLELHVINGRIPFIVMANG